MPLTPPSTDLLFHFADSEAAGAHMDGTRWRLRLAAASVVQGGRVSGHLRGVSLVCDGAMVSATGAQTGLGRISEGRARIADTWHAELPLPFVHTGPARLELSFGVQGEVAIDATGLALELSPDAMFTESLAC